VHSGFVDSANHKRKIPEHGQPTQHERDLLSNFHGFHRNVPEPDEALEPGDVRVTAILLHRDRLFCMRYLGLELQCTMR